MKKTTITLLLLILSGVQSLFAYTGKFLVSGANISQGYIIEKIWLNNYAMPKITISEIGYTANVSLPADAKVSDPAKFIARLGIDRKRPFVALQIPAFVAGKDASHANMVASFTISFEEDAPVSSNLAAKPTADVSTSALATGTWHKIGITKTGFYKIDKSVISAMGLDPANINPGNVRVFGNGGAMLSEDNDINRPADLNENPVQVKSNGDNSFDNDEYVIFYGSGPTGWNKDSVNKRFTHLKNLYSDTAYYFITTDKGASKAITTHAPVTGANTTVSSYNAYDVHDEDLVNPAGLGKNWYGETFSGNATRSFSFDMGAPLSDVSCAVSLASTSNVGGCSYTVSLNGALIATGLFPSPTTPDYVMNLTNVNGVSSSSPQVANVSVTFVPRDGSGIGYLNFIEINGRRSLSMTGDQMTFRDWQSVGAGNIANYQLSGAGGSTSVWDITNPLQPVIMSGTLSGSTYSFAQEASRLHEFAAMNSANLLTPKYIGTVANQNLHGLPQPNLIIVTHPDFLQHANQLADFHRNHEGMSVVVATTQQVFNEFSSGAQDICAIRDFARMFYKRAGTDSTKMPDHLLLFGGGSYDYKNRLANNCNFVPVFESAESLNDLNAFSSDDFYGFLDDSEYIENNFRLNVLDIGVGRLPARNTEDAANLVAKIIAYASPASLGPWRIATTIVADRGCVGNNQYDAAGNHMDDGEAAAGSILKAGKNLYNTEKVFTDAMPIISTPAGGRCPTSNAALNEQVFKGTFLINYNGHGNPQVWSGARILTQDDYNNWNNSPKLPIMVTATCDFGQFDHPQFVSAAEQLVNRKTGGVIATLTTTEAVYAFYNREINTQYLTDQFTRRADFSWKKFGDAYRQGKNLTFITSTNGSQLINFRKFALLGDPALTPAFPQYDITLDSATDAYNMKRADSIKALGAYIISGSVRDNYGSVLTNFNGMLSVAFYDKMRIITTISGCDDIYQVQNNVIYKGRVSVTNGKFSFTFITPRDINYYFGKGKISTYAENGTTDAAGADTTVVVGGFSDHPVISNEPPVVKPYINDSFFLNGGITGANTSLFVSLYSKTGINVSGNDIGHDLTAVLDGNTEAPYILNDYYETAPNTYQEGYVSFPISGLADGRHSITVKAWDVNNNSGEGTVDFMVVNGKVVDIEQLMNYPNPFSNTTHFVFEHNHPDEELDIAINIYNTSGGIVKCIRQTFTPSGSRTNEITWDGTDNNGVRLPSGMYVYRLNLSTDKGYKTTAYQKLVIVR
ncbi:MAG: hypothetical protein K0Q79_3272 [Flavipsychrobacter sp.]|jgi:hypothetical protein|nr:hypothetical protein [Flavipsychrobacter sp.]